MSSDNIGDQNVHELLIVAILEIGSLQTQTDVKDFIRQMIPEEVLGIAQSE